MSCHISNTLLTHILTLLCSKSGNSGLTIRWSTASFLPSVVIFSILSTLGSTEAERTRSARLPHSSTKLRCSSLGFATTVLNSALGTGKLSISAVCISAHSLKIFISSGKLKNFANLVFSLYFLPSGASSLAVTVVPKLEAQLSK